MLFLVITLSLSLAAALFIDKALKRTDYVATWLIWFFVAVSPSIAAIVCMKLVLKDRFPRGEFKINGQVWPYFLVALAYPICFGVLAFRIGEVFANQYLLEDRSEFFWTAALALPFFAVLALGEEIGWRSFLQPRIVPGRPLLAAMATSIPWILWHCPGLYLSEEVIDPDLTLLLYVVSLPPASVIYGYLRDRTGSVWAPAFAHGSFNFVVGIRVLVSAHVDVAFYLLTWIAAAAVALLERRRGLSRRPDASGLAVDGVP